MTPVNKDDYNPEELQPSPIQQEYAPVIFAQDTVAHVISLDMMTGKVFFHTYKKKRKKRKRKIKYLIFFCLFYVVYNQYRKIAKMCCVQGH